LQHEVEGGDTEDYQDKPRRAYAEDIRAAPGQTLATSNELLDSSVTVQKTQVKS
jgi:hypothetical protein